MLKRLASSVQEEIDGLDQSVLTSPALRTGHFVLWRDLVYYLPLVKDVIRRFYIPPNSHEAMHLDSPERGPNFAYAMAAARQRTAQEYRVAADAVLTVGGSEALDRFHRG